MAPQNWSCSSVRGGGELCDRTGGGREGEVGQCRTIITGRRREERGRWRRGGTTHYSHRMEEKAGGVGRELCDRTERARARGRCWRGGVYEVIIIGEREH